MIFDFLELYWSDILIVFLVLLIIISLFKHKKYEELKAIALCLVVQAEKALGSGTGSAKFSMVMDGLYNKMPSIIKFMFTKQELTELIEGAVVELKGLLATGADLKSYNTELFFKAGDGFNELY